MPTGRARNPGLFFDALGLIDRPFSQDVETDYLLTLARSVDGIATPLGTRAHARFVSPAVLGQASGVVIWTTDPQGLWVEGVWPDQNANVAMTTLSVVMVALTTPFGLQPYTYEEANPYPASMKPTVLAFTGATVGGVIAEVAFCPASRNLLEVLGSRFWIPPNIKLNLGSTATNAVFSGSVSVTWAP